MKEWWQRLREGWDSLKQRSPVAYVGTRVYERFKADEGNTQAASMAYYLTFSLFPLLLLLINGASLLISPQKAEQMVFRLLVDFPPAVRDVIWGNIANALSMRQTVTVLSLLALAWSSSNIFFALVGALNKVRGVDENRSFIRLRAVALLTAMAGFGLTLLSVLLDGIAAVLRALTRALGFETLPLIGPLIGQVLPALFTGSSLLLFTALLLAIYRGVPADARPLICLWPGALFGAIAWQLSKSAFAWYLSTVPSQTAIYGSVGAFISVLLWLYVSSLIILIGGELNESLIDWRRLSHD